MVLGYFFSEENGLPFSLKKIIVDRPVFFVSLFVITPVLFSLSRKNGMFDGKHKTAAGGQDLRNFPAYGGEIFHVMQRQGTDDDIKRVLGKINIFDGRSPEFDVAKAIFSGGGFQHFFRNVDTENLFCPVFGRVKTVPAEAAAKVQYAFFRKIGQQLFQFVPLSGGFQSVNGAGKSAVFGKEGFVIIFVFDHSCFPLNVHFFEKSVVSPALKL